MPLQGKPVDAEGVQRSLIRAFGSEEGYGEAYAAMKLLAGTIPAGEDALGPVGYQVGGYSVPTALQHQPAHALLLLHGNQWMDDMAGSLRASVRYISTELNSTFRSHVPWQLPVG